MRPDAQTRRSATSDTATANGMALMAVAMLLVPALDAIAKALGGSLSPFQIGFLRFALQSLFILAAVPVLARNASLRVPWRDLAALALGGAFIGASVGLLFWSLLHLPLANAIALFFIEPLVLTVMSAVFLGERVGLRRYAAVAVGLLGALVVIRPNWAAFGPVAVLPLLAATFYAAQLVVIRGVSGRVGAVQLQLYTGLFAALFLGLVLVLGSGGGLALFAWARIGRDLLLPLAGLGALSALCHVLMVRAFSRAEASLLAPFQYLEIISATVLGLVIFGDFPDALTWVGTFVILGAGLYVAHRERKPARSR